MRRKNISNRTSFNSTSSNNIFIILNFERTIKKNKNSKLSLLEPTSNFRTLTLFSFDIMYSSDHLLMDASENKNKKKKELHLKQNFSLRFVLKI